MWLCVPTDYSARTTLSDEYKETDIAIGLSTLEATLNSMRANTGMNDMETYCKLLATDDFARKLSHYKLADTKQEYGAYLAAQAHIMPFNGTDTIEAIKDNIHYFFSPHDATLTIQFTDRNAAVASEMLDAVTRQLANSVTISRQDMAKAQYEDAKKERHEAGIAYHTLQHRYAQYADSHTDATLSSEEAELDHLEKEVKMAREHYEDMAEKCVRYEVLIKRSACVFAVIKANCVPAHSNHHLLPYIIAFVLIALALCKAIRLCRQRHAEQLTFEWGGVFSPWLITIAVWAGMAVLFLIFGEELNPLSTQFFISISIWLPIFIITSLATFNLLPHRSQPLPTEGIDINQGIFYFFFALTIIISPLLLYKVYQIVSMFDSQDMLKNIRMLSVEGDGHGFLNYSYVLSQSLLMVALWRTPKLPRWQFIAIIVCCIINAIAIMEKGLLFVVFFCSAYVLFERKIIKLRTIGIMSILLVVVFFIINLMREGEDSDYAQEETLLSFVAMYVMSPPVAFGTLMRDVTGQFGANTLETIYLFLNRFGIGNFEVHQKLQEFVWVPIPTNVYTILQPFYCDFGYLGVAFFAWIYGILSGFIYRMSCNGNTICICLYTFLVQILILQFYQENIFLSMVFILQLVFFITLFTQKRLRFSFFGIDKPQGDSSIAQPIAREEVHHA